MEKTTKLARAVPPATALCVLCAYAAVANDSAVPIAGKRNRKPGSGSISAEGKRPGRQLPETVVPNRAPSNPRPAEQAAGYDERNRKPGSVFEKKTAKRPTGATGSDIDAAKRPATGRIRGAPPDRTASKRPDLPVRIVCRGEGAHAGFRKRKLTYKT